jgi:hypothetical protein
MLTREIIRDLPEHERPADWRERMSWNPPDPIADSVETEIENERLRVALADDIETLGAIADRLALGSHDRNTFEEIVARNRRLLGHAR